MKYIRILGIIFICYYFAISFYVGFRPDFSNVWLAAGIACFIIPFLYKQAKATGMLDKVPSPVFSGVKIIAVIGVLIFVGIGILIVSGMYEKQEKDLDYIVVLGAHVNGTRPSRVLRKRLDAAMQYMENNENTKAVLSGGQGSGESIAEAEAMKRFLMEKGIDEERLILENQSLNTFQNLEFSSQKMGSKEMKVGIISNNFHVYRAKQIAKKAGYTDVYGIPAKSDPLLQVNYVVREIFAVAKEKLVGNI